MIINGDGLTPILFTLLFFQPLKSCIIRLEGTKKPPKRRLLLIILLNQNLNEPKNYFLVRTKSRFSNSFKHFLNTLVLSSGSKPSM